MRPQTMFGRHVGCDVHTTCRSDVSVHATQKCCLSRSASVSRFCPFTRKQLSSAVNIIGVFCHTVRWKCRISRLLVELGESLDESSTFSSETYWSDNVARHMAHNLTWVNLVLGSWLILLAYCVNFIKRVTITIDTAYFSCGIFFKLIRYGKSKRWHDWSSLYSGHSKSH